MSDLHEHSKIEIENRLVAERAKLSGALEELRGRLSLDTLLEQGKAAVASHLAPGLQQIDQTVRAQPLMAGLAGVVSHVDSCAEASSGVWSGAAAGAGSSGEKVSFHAA